MEKTALIAGATGLVGSHCLDFLLNDSYYSRVVAVTRRSLTIQHPRLQEEIINFDEPEEYADKIQADHIFCCLGTTIKKAGSQEEFRKVDYQFPLNLAKATYRNGAQQFLVISSIGANPRSRLFYGRTKGEMEESIKEIPFIGIQIFRPSLLIGKRNELRIGEKIAEAVFTLIKPLLLGAWRKYRPIRARDVALGMVEIAKTELKGINIFESDQIQFFCDRISGNRSRYI
ncbi:MAG: oxidoreductase [Calditrichia bacterium]